MTPDFRPADDQTNPAVVAQKLSDLAAGMDQQATASRPGTALGGHPYPEHFYREVATWMRAGALIVASTIAPPKPTPNPEPASEPPRPGPRPGK